MAKTRPPYPPEFRRRIVELVRAGRTPEELSREFEPTAQSIRNWVGQAGLDEGRRDDGLMSVERDELRRLRRENRQLREEREILKKPRPGSRGRPARSRPGVRVRERAPGRPPGLDDVPRAGCLPQRLLRLAPARALCPLGGRRRADREDPPLPRPLEAYLRCATGAPGPTLSRRRSDSALGAAKFYDPPQT